MKSSRKVAVLGEFFQSNSKTSFSVGKGIKEFSIREIVFRSRKSKHSFGSCSDLNATSIANRFDTFGQNEIQMPCCSLISSSFSASDSSCLGRTIAACDVSLAMLDFRRSAGSFLNGAAYFVASTRKKGSDAVFGHSNVRSDFRVGFAFEMKHTNGLGFVM